MGAVMGVFKRGLFHALKQGLLLRGVVIIGSLWRFITFILNILSIL
jgi:hypothetical protein